MVSTNNDRGKIEKIKSMLDVVDVIGREIDLRSMGNGEYTGATSSSSKSGASLKVNQRLQIWKNFATGEGGDVFDWLGYVNRLDARGSDFPEVIRIAADLAGVELEDMTEEERNAAKEVMDIHDLFTEAAEIYHNNLKPEHYDYIKEKWGITRETVDLLKIGYANKGRNLEGIDIQTLKKSGMVYVNNERMSGEVFQGRITFPYWKNGKIVYLIGRQTAETPLKKDGKEPSKYQKLLVHSDKFPYVSPAVQNSYFYGEDSLRRQDYCIITEGVADCIAMLQAGFPCISPVTVQFREKDHPKLLSLVKGLDRVCICNDNEVNQAGLKGALSTAEALENAGIETRIIKLPKPEGLDKIDIADYMKEHNSEDFDKLIEEAPDYWDYILPDEETYSSKTTTVKLKALSKFISEDLKEMPGELWRPFVENEVVKRFTLTKKDAKAVIDAREEIRKKVSAGGSEEEEENSEEESSTNGGKLPPLELRLAAYPEYVRQKANDILDTGDPFQYILDTWNKKHVGDTELGETLLCSIGCTQVLNAALGVHNKPSGDAQSGKSHGCIKMGELCPEWKFVSTTFTAKNLYYNTRLHPGVIVYTDDVDLTDKNGEVIQTLKKATADFQSPTYLDTVIDGDAKTLSIPERVTFWLSSVTSIEDVQLGTRFIYSGTENGSEHNHEVSHKQNGRCAGKPLEADNEEVLVCRCILEYICDQLYYVFSPYGFVSNWTEESEKRNHEKFLDILMSVTVFNYRQRETVNDCLVGTLEDWKRAVSIYSKVAQNNSCLLTDEEILILYSIWEMGKAYDDGVPHRRLLAYMKEEGRFSKSDSTLKRMLIGKIGAENTGFKEKVPGFSFEKVSITKLDENGIEIRGAGKTSAMCYTYDGDLFDGIPKGTDVVDYIKNSTFVTCDYSVAEAYEKLFREDPIRAHSLSEKSEILENWKHSLGIQKDSSEISEIIRNRQNSNHLNSEKQSQPIMNNNNNIGNNNLRNHITEDMGVDEKCVCIADGSIEEETHAKIKAGVSPKNVNSVNSEATACDQALNSETPILNSEPTNSDYVLNSEPTILNSDTVSLLKRALNKFAWDEYHGTVADINEFVRRFNAKVPAYWKVLGRDAIGYNAKKLHMRGWK